ncbi:MAG TPA: M28 family peptidase, partial [Thermoplasmata archaeon]|nr:M28 family peptidase [Thermoplasmata archaeon]
SGYRFKHTIKFGLWNGEEVGLVGSSKWAAKAKQEAQDIRLYVGMDMVGFSGKSAQEMWMYSNTQSDAVRATATQLNTDYAIGADLTTQNCDCRNTDHKSFWNQGFTAVGTASEQTAAMDPTYHKPTDTVSHAMFDNLAVTTNVNLALLATSAVPVGKAQAIDRIEVTPPTASITADQTQQFAAKAYDSANQQVNATFAWAASGGAVDQAGLFTPGGLGTTTVYANASGKSGTATITVTPGQLVSIVVAPATATVPVSQTQQFTAKGEDARKNPVSVTPQWAVDGGGTVDGNGLFTAATQGIWKLYANSSSVSGTATIQVTGGGGGGVASISVEPAQVTVRSDQTAQFKAIGRDASGNSLGEVAVTWTAENGEIDSAGLFTPQKTGTWAISAAYQQISGAASVTVTPGPLGSLELEPRQATLKVGEKKKYSFFANDSKGNPIPGLPVTVGTEPDLGDFAADGTFTAKTAGSGKVKASATSLGATKTAEGSITVSEVGGGPGTAPPADLFSQPIFLIGIVAAVIAIVGIAALLATRRRKKPQMSPDQGPWGQPDWGGPPQ